MPKPKTRHALLLINLETLETKPLYFLDTQYDLDNAVRVIDAAMEDLETEKENDEAGTSSKRLIVLDVLPYDPEKHHYPEPPCALHDDFKSMTHAAKMLGVTPQRISQAFQTATNGDYAQPNVTIRGVVLGKESEYREH